MPSDSDIDAARAEGAASERARIVAIIHSDECHLEGGVDDELVDWMRGLVRRITQGERAPDMNENALLRRATDATVAYFSRLPSGRAGSPEEAELNASLRALEVHDRRADHTRRAGKRAGRRNWRLSE